MWVAVSSVKRVKPRAGVASLATHEESDNKAQI